MAIPTKNTGYTRRRSETKGIGIPRRAGFNGPDKLILPLQSCLISLNSQLYNMDDWYLVKKSVI